MFHPTLKIKIYQEDLVFGPGLVILMEHILVTESMKDACGEMGMSYSKGWKIINRAEKELGYELLERRHGGKSGGKCTVTEKGKSLMKRYRQMEEETRDCLQKSFESISGISKDSVDFPFIQKYNKKQVTEQNSEPEMEERCRTGQEDS